MIFQLRKVIIFSDFTWCRMYQLANELKIRRCVSQPKCSGFDPDDFDYTPTLIDGFFPTGEEIEWHVKMMMGDY